MTSFRIMVLGCGVLAVAAILVGLKLLEKRGFHMTAFCKLLLIVGALLTLDTLVVSQLSNYNLGVILPAFFGVPMMAMAFLLPKLTHGFGSVFKWFVAACYGVAIVIFIVCGILMTVAKHEGDHTEAADAVIVLGAAVHGDKVTWVLSNRLDTAITYLNAHPDAVAVVSGGQGPEETVTEASAMAKYMIERGIDETRILLEEQARNTVENFTYSKQLIDEKLGNDAKIAFVTTGFHVYRADRVAAAQGIDTVGIPAADVWYLAVNNFMRESVGICVYALRGNFS